MSFVNDYLPLVVLACVFALTAFRQIGGIRLKLWQIMLGGAVAVLVAGASSLQKALHAINPDVMVFLFGMFAVGEALAKSGYLYHVFHEAFKGARSTGELVFLMLFVIGFLSAILMNDTLAIIGTPLALFYAEKHGISAKLLLLTLCFAVTTGSVMSPIGNPQNLIIAVEGNVADPFIMFLKYLGIPTVINLGVVYVVLRLMYRDDFHSNPLDTSKDAMTDPQMANLCKVSLAVIAVLIIAKAAGSGMGVKWMDMRLSVIAAAGCLPVLLGSGRRVEILKSLDWHTLVFFASMFVLMDAVWSSGAFQSFMNEWKGGVNSTWVVLISSVLLSQILSNVPFVSLYLPVLSNGGTAAPSAAMALAAGSTIAGNLFILGAASNIIVIQNAEKRGETLTFLEFARAGVPITIINTFVYWIYFRLAL